MTKIQSLIADLYQQGKIQQIQEQSAKVYKYCKSKGLSHEKSVNEVLSHGVKYEDLLSGLLILSIDKGDLEIQK